MVRISTLQVYLSQLTNEAFNSLRELKLNKKGLVVYLFPKTPRRIKARCQFCWLVTHRKLNLVVQLLNILSYLTYLLLKTFGGQEKRRVVVIIKHIDISSVFQQV